jgi:mannose-6-phosphate isomerase-like protein (cupin superfamily)
MPDPRQPTHINLASKLGEFSEHWSPKIVARYNDNEVRLVKADSEFVWHKHDETDELFLILEGEFDVDFRDRTVVVKAGELLIVPRGTEHRPAARRGEVKLLLIDPSGTPNTGSQETVTPAVEL